MAGQRRVVGLRHPDHSGVRRPADVAGQAVRRDVQPGEAPDRQDRLQRHGGARLLAAGWGRRQPSDIARAYQQRYDVVLVDEFQDTNPIQAAIVHMVSRESADPPQPNLFVVGDVKQSIYGFRMTDPGCSPSGRGRSRGARWLASASTCRRISASRPEVLEFVNGVFAKLMRQVEAEVEYDAAAALKVGRTDFPRPGGPVVELHVLEGSRAGTSDEEAEGGGEEAGEEDGESMRDQEKEAYLIASRIRELRGKPYLDHKSNEVRPLSYGNMVILLRSTQTSAEVFADALRRARHPGVRGTAERVLRQPRDQGHAQPAAGAGEHAAGHPAGRGAAKPAVGRSPVRRGSGGYPAGAAGPGVPPGGAVVRGGWAGCEPAQQGRPADRDAGPLAGRGAAAAAVRR